MSIFIVAGLGNPGREYATTRHNAGFAVIDALAERHGLAWRTQSRFEAKVARWDRADGRTCLLAKPQTFMNESGRAVRVLADFYKLSPADRMIDRTRRVACPLWASTRPFGLRSGARGERSGGQGETWKGLKNMAACSPSA